MAAVAVLTLATATTMPMIADAKDAAVGVAARGAAALGVVATGVAIGVAAVGVAEIGKAVEKGSAAAMEMDLNGRQTSFLFSRRLASCGMTRIPTEVSCGCDGFGSSLCDTIDNIHVISICICVACLGRQFSSFFAE